MPKTIYLHIGMHKTGSTAIQTGLYHNREQLEARGYVYPCLGENEVAHHNLAWELLQQDEQFDPTLCIWSNLQHAIEKTQHDKVIISSEHFSQATPSQLQTLAIYLSGYHIKIVVYLRRQDQIIQSSWSQNIKLGLTTVTFDAWLERFILGRALPDESFSEILRQHLPHYVPRQHYAPFIAQYADVFGQENIMVRAYERTYLNSNIVADFLQFIGMDDVAWVQDNPEQNVSPSIKTLEFLRQMALGWQEKTNNDRFRDTLAYQEYCSQLEQLVDSLGWNNQRLNLIDRTRYDQVMDVYEESNNIVAQTYLGRDQLFREPFTERPVTTFDTSDFQNDELITMMQEISAKHLWMLKTQQTAQHTQQVHNKPSLITKLRQRLQSLLCR